METKYSNLLSPMTIGKFTFKNRMLSGPLGFCVPNEGGAIHPHNLEYYEIQAQGGAARVTTNDYSIGGGGLGGVDFSYVDINLEKSLNEYVRTMHRNDTLAFVEFSHGGYPVTGDLEDPDEEPLVSPGGPPPRPGTGGPGGPGGPGEPGKPGGPGAPHPVGDNEMPPAAGPGSSSNLTIADLSVGQMNAICDAWALCCKNAKAYGIDGVILHGGHNKLIDQFRSRRHNRRTDEFGGPLENRCRFVIMLLERVRAAVGNDMLVELRLSADEGYEGGITIDETIEFLKLIDGKGLIDLFHVTAGDHTTAVGNMHTSSPAFFPETPNRKYAKAIKDAGIRIPLVLINSINDPDIAEDIIASGDAEFVCMARQIAVADPYFPRKVREGRIHEINTCIRCHNCFDREECAVNPITMDRIYNLTYRVPKADDPKKIAVIGGGIAGLKAAETAGARGHDVTLYEKLPQLGGVLRFSDTDSYKFDIRRYKNNMIARVEAMSNVRILLNTEASPETVAGEAYDAVLVAIGAQPKIPQIPGIQNGRVLLPMDVYDHPEKVGSSVIMLGGGLQACEMALHLAKCGKRVTIVNRRSKLAANEKINNAVFNPIPVMKKMFREFEYPVQYILDCECSEITDTGIVGTKKDGTSITLTAETVVLNAGSLDQKAAGYAYQNTAPFVQLIGDCREPKKIKQAVAGGYYSAMNL